jgi:hypothetical protein
MKKEEYLTRLVGVLTKFTRDQSDLSPGEITPLLNDEFSIVLSDTLPVEVKGVVYEIQVHVLLGMTHEGRYITARNICRKALDIYTEAGCPLRRVRVIERLLYLSVVTGDDTEDLLTLGAGAISSLTSTKVHRNYDLADSRHSVEMRDCTVPENLFLRVVLHGWACCQMSRILRRPSAYHKPLGSGVAGQIRQSTMPPTRIEVRWQTLSKFWVPS